MSSELLEAVQAAFHTPYSVIDKRSFRLQLHSNCVYKKKETMPSVSHFLHRLKSLSIMSSIPENRPAESISFMSVTTKELSSKLELMSLSFYLCSDNWVHQSKFYYCSSKELKRYLHI